MLVLSRKPGERIVIGDGISIVVNRISGNRVAIGIEAPSDQRIVRGELLEVVDSFRESERQEPGSPSSTHEEDPSLQGLEMFVGGASYAPNLAR